MTQPIQSWPAPPPPEVPTPLSRDRLVALCQQRGWNYFIDNQGDLGGHWVDARYYFLVRGSQDEILVIHGIWNRMLPFESLATVRSAILFWHRDRLWPTLTHHIHDDGTIEVGSDVAIDLEHGATDAQLADHIDRAVSTSGQAFAALSAAIDHR